MLYSDGSGVELKAGTTLPNGVQLSPKEITSTGEINKVLNATVIAPDDGVKLSDGTVIKSGGTLVGEAMVRKGQLAEPGEYVVSRNSVDTKTGAPTIDTYPTRVRYWTAVPGKPGIYAPNSDSAYAISVIQVPAKAIGNFDVSYGGIAPFEPGDIIARNDKKAPDGSSVPGFRRISEQAAVETYRGVDAATKTVLDNSAISVSDKTPVAIPLAYDNAADFAAARQKLESTLRSAVDSDPARLLTQAEEQGGKIRIGDVQINVTKDRIGDVPRSNLNGPSDEAATFKAVFHRFDQDLQKFRERTGGSPVDSNGFAVWKFDRNTDPSMAADIARDAAAAGSKSLIVQLGGDLVRVTPGMSQGDLNRQRSDYEEKSRILDFRLREGVSALLQYSLMMSSSRFVASNRIESHARTVQASFPSLAVWDKQMWDELPASSQHDVATAQGGREGSFEPLKPEQTQALEQAKSQVVAKLADTTGDDGDAAKALLGSSTNAEADGKIAYKFARDVDPAKAVDIATKVATATQLEIPIELNGIKLTARPEMFKEKLQSDYEFAFARARAERLAIVRSSRRDGAFLLQMM